MATIEQLSQALKKADEAGNTEDARKLAAAIRERQSGQGGAEPEQAAPDEEGFSVGDYALGGVETAGTMLSGAVAEPIAGIVGLGTGLVNAVRGDDDTLGSMVEAIEGTQEALTYQPRTEAGQEVTQTVAKPFQWYTEQMEGAGQAVVDATGSPAAGTVVSTAGQMAPAIIGARGAPKALSQRRRDVSEAKEAADREGISLNKRGSEQADQIVSAGQRRATSTPGDAMPDIQQAVSSAREAAQTRVNELYNSARQSNAGVRVEQMADFVPMVRESLKDFDTDMMPVVEKRLGELRQAVEMPKGSKIKLNAIAQWKQRLNKNRPAKSDRPQNAALDILRAQTDRFLENQFNADMISGDADALSRWRQADIAFKEMKETFDANRAIKDMAKQNATPEEMRRWVFGASLVGANKQAGSTVRRIKDIVGKDSPQFQALRDDAALDLMEPLTRDTPSLKAFVTNYDRFIRNNQTVAKELFTPEQIQELRQLRNFASANIKRGDAPPNIPLARMGSVFALGHGIARAGMKVRMGQKIADALIKKSNKREFLGEVFGYDPGKPLIPAPTKTATIQSGERMGQEEEEQDGARRPRE